MVTCIVAYIIQRVEYATDRNTANNHIMNECIKYKIFITINVPASEITSISIYHVYIMVSVRNRDFATERARALYYCLDAVKHARV